MEDPISKRAAGPTSLEVTARRTYEFLTAEFGKRIFSERVRFTGYINTFRS